MIFQSFHDACNRRRLLTDSDVNANTILPLLIDNGIDSDSRFAYASVADNQFALSASNGNERVYSLKLGREIVREYCATRECLPSLSKAYERFALGKSEKYS